MICSVVRISPGWVGYCRTEAGLWAVTLPENTPQEAAARLPAGSKLVAVPESEEAIAGLLRDRLEAFFSGRAVDFSDLPLDWAGYTSFVRAVLEACRAIPRGGTATYGELARAVGRPRAARAVGNALGANRTPVLIPCHRVVRSDGTLGGFTGGGTAWKERLLALERSDALQAAK